MLVSLANEHNNLDKVNPTAANDSLIEPVCLLRVLAKIKKIFARVMRVVFSFIARTIQLIVIKVVSEVATLPKNDVVVLTVSVVQTKRETQAPIFHDGIDLPIKRVTGV